MKPAHFVFIIAVLSGSANAAPRETRSPLTQRVLDVCNDFEKRGKFSGALYIKTNGSVEIDEAIGNANNAGGISNSPETAFRIGALTRAFTSVAILKLAAEGRISLDDTMQKHLPELSKPETEKITIHQLLSNTSGIPDYLPTWKTAWRMKAGASEQPAGGFEGVLSQVSTLSPAFEPGTKGESSSSNFMLLGRILEKVEVSPFPIVMRRLLDSAGLTQTGFHIDREVPNSMRAIGHGSLASFDPRAWFSKNRKAEKELRHPEWDLASSSLYSTTRNLALWTNVLSSDRILPQSWREKMLAKHAQKSSTQWFGYGWEVHQGNGVEGAVLTGAHPGYQSLLIFVPQSQTTVVVLENFGDTPSSRARFFREVINATLQPN